MALSLIPNLQYHVFKRMSQSTVSKATLKSIVTMAVTYLFSMAHSESFTNLNDSLASGCYFQNGLQVGVVLLFQLLWRGGSDY